MTTVRTSPAFSCFSCLPGIVHQGVNIPKSLFSKINCGMVGELFVVLHRKFLIRNFAGRGWPGAYRTAKCMTQLLGGDLT